jgi:chemotaxis protein histidine kinase CheA
MEVIIEHLIVMEDEELEQLLLNRLGGKIEEQSPAVRVRYYVRQLTQDNVIRFSHTTLEMLKILASLKNNLSRFEESAKDYLGDTFIHQSLRNALHDNYNSSHRLSTEIGKFLIENNHFGSQQQVDEEEDQELRAQIIHLCSKIFKFSKSIEIGPTEYRLALRDWISKRNQREKHGQHKKQPQQQPQEPQQQQEEEEEEQSTVVLSRKELQQYAKQHALDFNSIINGSAPPVKRYLESRRVTTNLKKTSDQLLNTNKDPLKDTLDNLDRVQDVHRKLNAPHPSATRVLEHYLTSDDEQQQVQQEEEEEEDVLSTFRDKPAEQEVDDNASPMKLNSAKKKVRKSKLAKKADSDNNNNNNNSNSKKKKKRARSSDATEQSSSTKKRKKTPFTDEEVDNLKAGVAKFGEGSWTTILKNYQFDDSRTGTSLRDKYRNLKKYNQL